MKSIRWTGYLFVFPLVCGIIAAGWIVLRRYSYPDLTAYQRYVLPEAPPGTFPIVRWLGATTLLLDDGDTALMTDGFFSAARPPAYSARREDHSRSRTHRPFSRESKR